MKVIVLGAGMVGSTIAIDLKKSHDVTAVDINKTNLNQLSKKYKINFIVADISNQNELKKIVNNYDLVISAVPGFIGFQTLKTIIETRKNVVDISFLPENSLELDKIAKKNNVTAIVDFGVAPGLSNIILGYHNEIMKISEFECLVGGLPKIRTFPFEYKAPFSPIDVIEEYTRPVRIKENHKIILKTAMSEPELINFDNVGTLEAFNTDGLRSLIYTLKNIPNMKEKTLRYPGHIKLIQALQTSGFFNLEPINVDGKEVVPFNFTTKLLFSQWKLNPNEEEFTIMRIKIKGKENRKKKEIIYDLYDEYDKIENQTSMARTTGFTANAGAELILQKKFKLKGVFPPELVGKYKNLFNFILNYLKQRNISLKVKVNYTN